MLKQSQTWVPLLSLQYKKRRQITDVLFNLRLCVHMHLHACVHELFVNPPQALSCWVCSLKRLCFCCHPSLPPFFPCSSFTPLPSSVFSVYLHHSPSLCCLSVFHYWCFIIIVGKAKCCKPVSVTAFHIQHSGWAYAIWEGSWLVLAVLRT